MNVLLAYALKGAILCQYINTLTMTRRRGEHSRNMTWKKSKTMLSGIRFQKKDADE